MKLVVRIAYLCLLPLSLAFVGCESVSLIKRPDPYANDEYRNRDIDRSREARRDQDFPRARDGVVGTVQRVDPDRQPLG